jgi:hypothetical protein
LNIALLFLVIASAASAALPRFRAPFILQVHSSNPAAGTIVNPFFFNLNDDGMNDAIVDWSLPTGKGRIYRYYSTDRTHLAPVPVSYVQTDAAPALTLQESGDNLTVGLIANPFLADWNGDGLNDLIVGQLLDSKVRFYPNIGTNQDPVFMTYTYLQADGADITATFS